MLIKLTSVANFTAALDDLHIVRSHALYSMSISRDLGKFEWASSSVFAQWSNFIRPSFWRMLFDIIRFNTFASDILLPTSEEPLESIGDYLDREGYSKQFRADYIQRVLNVWSTLIILVNQCTASNLIGSPKI
jgi:predicted NAD/FAD-binding protein